jgi:hypothetical protein
MQKILKRKGTGVVFKTAATRKKIAGGQYGLK